MELILWRHAEAEDGNDDLARELTPRGRRQAARMAQWLTRHVPPPWQVYASPARRTQETVAALHVPFQTLPECRPGASAETVLSACGWPDYPGTVILVGHQPALGMAVAQALTGREFGWSLRKGSIAWLTSRSASSNLVQLRATIGPDLLS